jgi:CspA family cold shock protein
MARKGAAREFTKTAPGSPTSFDEDRQTGTVKWFNDAKGFGFIVVDGGGKDCFVHHSGIAADGFRTLAEGQRVEFTVEASAKGPQAINVVKIA